MIIYFTYLFFKEDIFLKLKYFFGLLILILLFTSYGCGTNNHDDLSTTSNNQNNNDDNSNNTTYLTSADIDVQDTKTASDNDEHVIEIDGSTESYSNLGITKTGDASSNSDNADFYGYNSAVFVTNGGTLDLTDSLVVTNGAHANAVFSYGSGSTVNISDSVILTYSDNSGGIMTTGGGTTNAENLTIETQGGSSAPIRSDRGGGNVTVKNGSYTSNGRGSPAIYSTANINVSNAFLEAKSSQGIVVEGKNSVTLTDSDIVATHRLINGDQTALRQAVMIYQSQSGDADEGESEFSMTGGSIINNSGDIFFVTNTTCKITLDDVDITNNDPDGVFLRLEAAGWGSSGSNGGKANFYANDQNINGDIIVDDSSVLNLYLDEGSVFTGIIKNEASTSASSVMAADSSTAQVYVEISDTSTWTLTGDTYITSLKCGTDSVNLNGHNLYVNNTAYTEGTASNGEALDISTDSSNSGGNTPPDIPSDGPGSGDHGPDNISGDNRPGGNDDGSNRPGENDDSNRPDGSDDSSNTGSNDTSMNFDATNYTSSSVNSTAYRAYNNLVYVANPVNENYQRMSIYIPEAYFQNGTINGYTAATAPIFMPNNVGGYMAGSIMSANSDSIAQALTNGLVVAAPALRGRNTDNGTAPACIVDYKAAVRYLRKNKDNLPAGNTDKIISCGTSAGGAISALLGAAGNSSDYDEWLEELGAADASDDIFASMCYCPITDLDHSDMAYEWVFGGDSGISATLKSNYNDYINGLQLKIANTVLTLDSNGEGTFKEYIEGLYVSSANAAISEGTSVNANWLTLTDGQATDTDLSAYASSFASRQKTAPAFDKFDLTSAENNEFGNKHFTEFSLENTTASGTIADSEIIKAMNPLNYIGTADTAKFWRIRHGTDDRDTTLAVPAVLALKLQNNDCNVDFAAPWGEGHGGDYDLDELFSWIDEICKN